MGIRNVMVMVMVMGLVFFGGIDVGEGVRYRLPEPCFGNCMKSCVGDLNSKESLVDHCKTHVCTNQCYQIECIFC
ncbi:hypothetical protein CsatB_011714 [Cannabis sativa]